MVLVPLALLVVPHPTPHRIRLVFNADLQMHRRPTLPPTDPTPRETTLAWPWVTPTSITTTKATTSKAHTVTMTHTAPASNPSSGTFRRDGTQGSRTPRSSRNKETLVSHRTSKLVITIALYSFSVLDIRFTSYIQRTAFGSHHLLFYRIVALFSCRDEPNWVTQPQLSSWILPCTTLLCHDMQANSTRVRTLGFF